MIEGVEEEYAYKFFKRFRKDLKKDKETEERLENYEEIGGHYTITLDSRARKFASSTEKLIKVPEKKELDEIAELKLSESKIIKVPEKKELEGKFKKMEKCIVGIYLPDNLQEFLQLCERKSTLIEAGEGRDAIVGKISIKERRGEKEYYLKGPLLHRMRGALIEDVPLEKVLRY